APIRIYEGDTWSTAPIQQSQILPDKINMKIKNVGIGPFSTTFNFRGEIPNAGQLRTIYLTRDTDNTNYDTAGLDACAAATTCKAVVISTVLGKVRTIQ
ncbi:MAG TPA: hypothetical protein VIJ25_11650, partial [Methylococcales bacterium]